MVRNAHPRLFAHQRGQILVHHANVANGSVMPDGVEVTLLPVPDTLVELGSRMALHEVLVQIVARVELRVAIVRHTAEHLQISVHPIVALVGTLVAKYFGTVGTLPASSGLVGSRGRVTCGRGARSR